MLSHLLETSTVTWDRGRSRRDWKISSQESTPTSPLWVNSLWEGDCLDLLCYCYILGNQRWWTAGLTCHNLSSRPHIPHARMRCGSAAAFTYGGRPQNEGRILLEDWRPLFPLHRHAPYRQEHFQEGGAGPGDPPALHCGQVSPRSVWDLDIAIYIPSNVISIITCHKYCLNTVTPVQDHCPESIGVPGLT